LGSHRRAEREQSDSVAAAPCDMRTVMIVSTYSLHSVTSGTSVFLVILFHADDYCSHRSKRPCRRQPGAALSARGSPVLAIVHADRRGIAGLDVQTVPADVLDPASLDRTILINARRLCPCFGNLGHADVSSISHPSKTGSASDRLPHTATRTIPATEISNPASARGVGRSRRNNTDRGTRNKGETAVRSTVLPAPISCIALT
jgi:hypothetical protein